MSAKEEAKAVLKDLLDPEIYHDPDVDLFIDKIIEAAVEEVVARLEGGEVWVNKNNKNPSVSCRCRRIRKVAEGEQIIIRGREYLQLILPLKV